MTETTQHLATIEAIAARAVCASPPDVPALLHAAKLLCAEEVQLRRKLCAAPRLADGSEWIVWAHVRRGEEKFSSYFIANTPADALLAADEWVRENVDPKPKGA